MAEDKVGSMNTPVSSPGIQGDGTALKGTFDSPGTHVPLDRTPHNCESTIPPSKGGKE